MSFQIEISLESTILCQCLSHVKRWLPLPLPGSQTAQSPAWSQKNQEGRPRHWQDPGRPLVETALPNLCVLGEQHIDYFSFMHHRLVLAKRVRDSLKLWAMPCRATQDRQVTVRSSDKSWSTGGRNGKLLQYLCHATPWIIWKGKKMWHWKMHPPDWKVSSMLLGKSRGKLLRASKRMKQQKWCSAVAVSGGESKLWCCKEQCCIGTWNVRSMNQGK